MIFLLVLTGFAQAASFQGHLVKGSPWQVKVDVPRRGEHCLKLPLEIQKKPWLVDGLYVEFEGVKPEGEKCLEVKTMLPTTFDPARSVIQKAPKR